ncbi:patatin-like phospholipase family protein [Actinomycetospora aeridis]|uniref:Patatin-like phospholipase family protein n=1 Tax=Actinomycetospora aeridis TaxID=3129231 RepID=A0ABU8MZS8_9PSEU
MSGARIGLALSGGGFRATAFGLGALRGLHDLDLLRHVDVVSGVSGGSLLAAMWAYGPTSFDEFDDTVVELLRSGLQIETARRAASPRRLIRRHNRTRRPGGLTDVLADTIACRPFGARLLPEVTHPHLSTMLAATDLASGNAVRFGSDRSSCSRFGEILDPIPVCDAVAASCAYPVFLPPLTRTYTFRTRFGEPEGKRLRMTDGGVYDNMGISPLMPGRSRTHTAQVYDPDYIVAVDAASGRETDPSPTPRGIYRLTLARSFDITHTKTQDGNRAQLHTVATNGQLRGFVHAYLGMQDRNLPIHVEDYVPRCAVDSIGTSFKALTETELQALTTRGEQLTRVLTAHYHPELAAPRTDRAP